MILFNNIQNKVYNTTTITKTINYNREININTHTIKKKFRSSIKRGTGEAYLIIRDNPAIDFTKEIIDASLKNYAFDGQSESDRAVYLSEIIELASQKDTIKKAIIQGLLTEQEDTWSLTQLFHLAQIFAENGNTEARQAMYHRFYTNPIEGSDWVGSQEIITLDGLKGLLFIADKIGRSLADNPDDRIWDWDIKECREQNPSINVDKELEKAGMNNKYIKLYIDNVRATNKQLATNKPKPAQYKDIIDEIENTKYFPPLIRKKITGETIEIIAAKLRSTTDIKKIETYLNFFQYFRYPFNSDLILKYAQMKPTSKNRIVEYALCALSHLKSDKIRDFALKKIAGTSRPEYYLPLLTHNYEDGDYRLLTSIATKAHAEHRIENLAIVFIDIYNTNKTFDCKQPLEIIYNKLTCGIHRESLIEVLLKNNVLSDKIREEAMYDSYLETRELVSRKNRVETLG